MSGTLAPIDTGVYAWLADHPSHGNPNAGVVIGSDGVTVIDSCTVPSQSIPLAAELAALTDLPIRRLLYTGSHLDQVGGSLAFPLAAVYGSAQTSDHLDQPANPDTWSRLHPGHASELSELVTRAVSHTVDEAAYLCPACIAVPTGGYQFENLVVQVPGSSVLFAGAMASFGVVPLGFDADFPAWIEALEALGQMGELFVPGHGHVGGTEELGLLRQYLNACVDAAGDPSRIPAGAWDSWADSHFTPINVERAAMLAAGDPSPPPSLLGLLGLY
ncbi:MAG: MBL fold metallo-hydrolase [Acidimicrobiales bacterium]